MESRLDIIKNDLLLRLFTYFAAINLDFNKNRCHRSSITITNTIIRTFTRITILSKTETDNGMLFFNYYKHLAYAIEIYSIHLGWKGNVCTVV